MTATPATPTPASPTPRQARRPYPACRARRGSIYAVVLGMSILVALIGLSTIAVSRINLRSTSVTGEAGEAELLALSAVEHAMSVVNADAAWRTNYLHDVAVPKVALGRGRFTWKLLDDADASLSGGGLQPVRVVGYGFVGVARRAFSVQLLPTGTNVLENPGSEAGLTGWSVQASDCVLESHTTSTLAGEVPHGGSRFLLVKNRLDKYSGPQQQVLGKVKSGTSYYVEAWVKMSTAPEQVWFSVNVKRDGAPGSEVIDKVVANVPAGTEWTKVSATYNPAWTGTETEVRWRIETGASPQDFLVDDAKIVAQVTGIPMAPSLGTWKQVPVEGAMAAN